MSETKMATAAPYAAMLAPPSTKLLQAYRKPGTSPKAARRYTYSPPASGSSAPSSAKHSAPNRASIHWARGAAAFTDNRYSRAHSWRFDGGVEVPASSSPRVVRVPLSVEAAVDPEEALVAALSKRSEERRVGKECR